MLATRYALMYPQQVERLAMVNPIGLEDWKALGVPYRSVDQWYARELKLDAEGVREYERKTYYAGRWKPEYERWVQMLVGLNKGAGHEAVAWNSALIYDMIFTQPVYYEFKDLKMPTLLLIGDQDSTAIGSDIAPPEVKARLGKYKELGPQVAKLIPQAELVTSRAWGTRRRSRSPGASTRHSSTGWRSNPGEGRLAPLSLTSVLPDLGFAPPQLGKIPDPQPSLLLAEEFIQLRWPHRRVAEHGMHLATVVDLVLEHMRQQAQALLALHPVRPHDAHVARQLVVAQHAAIGDQSVIRLGLFGMQVGTGGERLLRLEEALAVGVRRLAALLALEHVQVEPVHCQQVVERRLIDGKKLQRGATNSSCVSCRQALYRRWLAQPLL